MNLTKRLRVAPGTRVRLDEVDPADTAGLSSKEDALPLFMEQQRRIGELEYRLYAENKRSLLIILQAMDAGGKDGTIRHVMGGLNPQSCRVTAFKAPTAEELRRDFLWRIHAAVPGRGEIGIFNRSHYEDVLIARVRGLVPKSVWKARYAQINAFERLLAENGTCILKFFLHISKREQLKRLTARLKDPARQWKVTADDFGERRRWRAVSYTHLTLPTIYSV